MIIRTLINKRLVQPVAAQLKQGVSLRKLAMSLALGVVLGIFPAFGVASLLCFIAASIGRLNQVAIQAANYLVYPLQVALLIPFYQAGAAIFQTPMPPLTAAEVIAMIDSGIFEAINSLWWVTMRGIAVWLMMAPVLILTLYFWFVRLLQRFNRSVQLLRSKAQLTAAME